MIAFQRPELLILLILAAYPMRNLLQVGRYGKIVSSTRAIAVMLLVFAAAGPQMTVEEQRMQTPEVTVLEDRTNSMQVVNGQELDLQDVETDRRVVATGNNSRVVQNMMNSIEEDRAYVVRSDFQGEDWQQLSQTAQRKNATLYAYRQETDRESSVQITGPETTVPGAETSFRAQVKGTERDVPVQLYLDGERVASSTGEVEFERVFEQEGRHTLRAEIATDDSIEANNEYFKTFSVNQKPDVLVLGPEGSLEGRVSDYFDLENRQQVPENLNDYYAVVAKKGFEDEELAEYIAEGNGLVYTGDYGSSSVLPVESTSDTTEQQDTRIILAVDMSESQSENLAITQRIAYSLADSLPGNTKLGIVTYKRYAHAISEPETLAYTRDEVKDKISRLHASAASYHYHGLRGAREMADGEGNIILITDGKIESSATVSPERMRQNSYDAVEGMEPKLTILGVGDDVNTGFLRELSSRTRGEFVRSNDISSLMLRLDAGGGSGSISSASVWDSSHYITRNLQLDSQPGLYDGVEAKAGARTLVGSRSGEPVLTTWRYGLGRVAAFSADNSNLEALMNQDPLLGVRTINWAVGDSQRKLDDWLRVDDTGETVRIESSSPREGFKRKGDDLYVMEIEKEGRGFNQVSRVTYASNVDQEFIEMGYSESMNEIVESTGGEVFSSGEESELRDEIVNYSEQKVSRQASLIPYLLGLGIVILLSEIGFRKLNGKR
jgi:hypothetical protein